MHMYLDKLQLDQSILAQKKLGYQFFCWTIFFHSIVNNFLELLRCKINFLPSRKKNYSKQLKISNYSPMLNWRTIGRNYRNETTREWFK